MPLTEQFLRDVAAAMTGQWSAELIYEHSGRLTDLTGLIIVASCPPRGQRVEWTGAFPRDLAGALHMPSDRVKISVALARPPDTIARDLERRLLTWYRPALAEALEHVREADRRDAATASTAEALGRIFGQEPRERRLWFNQGTLEAGVSGIRVNLTLPLTDAEAVGIALFPFLTYSGRHPVTLGKGGAA